MTLSFSLPRSRRFVLLSALALSLAGCGHHDQTWQLNNITGVMPNLDFQLTNDLGQKVTAENYKGKIVLLYFGYTHCPDVCPTTLAELSGAQKQWASIPDATRPRVLFVTADPERDTPELVGQYAHAFHPDSLAATAPLPQMEAFARSLSLVFMKVPGKSGQADDYTLDHSAAVVLLDPQARMAGVIQPPFDIKEIAADLQALTKAAP